MQKIILITGSTDGIGLATAKKMYSMGHYVLLHGRNSEKLKKAEEIVSNLTGNGLVESYVADLSNLDDVNSLADTVLQKHDKLDVLINNAGILKTANTITQDGLDVRFMVNTIAPYLLTKRLLPLFAPTGRIINLSSAAQAAVNFTALAGEIELDDMAAYAQSKLAITIWTAAMANEHQNGPIFIAVNPGSLLASKMVKEGFGHPGNDIGIGVQILVRAAFSDEFASVSGQYFDNDIRQFALPAANGLDPKNVERTVAEIESIIARLI